MAVDGFGGTVTDWESRWAEGDTPWDKGKPAPPLEEWLENNRVVGDVLVPGCGSGHDVRLLARDRETRPVGLDVSPTALRQAESVGTVGHERYVLGDFFDFPERLRGTFDWVVEHTCFCAIDPALREQYVESVCSALRPRGKLLAVFFINPDHDEEGPPFGVSDPELDALFLGRFERIESIQPTVAYEGREGREQLQVLQLR